MSLRSRLATGMVLAPAAVLGLPASVAAHGFATPPLEANTALTSWSFDPVPLVGVLGALGLYLAGVARVNRVHPGNRVRRLRIAAWLTGVAVLAVALFSAVDVFATSLFSVHMLQHVLLTMVAAPLLALGAPITLLLRVVSPRVRRGLVLPFLHSRVVRVLAFPVVTWVIFAAVMWGSHFSALFDASLENPLIHNIEHLLFLGAAALFWWPVVGADPSPWRLGYGARIGYLALGMPQNTFLGLAIYSAPAVLYPHYQTLIRPWGPDPLTDQQLAGGLMWVGGDFLFIVPLLLAVAAWMRAEEDRGRRLDAQLARQRGRGSS